MVTLRRLEQRITYELPDGRPIPGAPAGRFVIEYGSREDGLRMVQDLAHKARKAIEESDGEGGAAVKFCAACRHRYASHDDVGRCDYPCQCDHYEESP